MAKVITLTGIGDFMGFATPEALECLESGGIPVWADDHTMTCNGNGSLPLPNGGGGAPIAAAPIVTTPAPTAGFNWKNALKYAAVIGGGAGLGYFALDKRMGTPTSAAIGGTGALLALLAFQPGGWLNKGTA